MATGTRRLTAQKMQALIVEDLQIASGGSIGGLPLNSGIGQAVPGAIGPAAGDAYIQWLISQLQAAGVSVTLGEIVDGAIARAKLELGFQEEFAATASQVFPNGFDQDSSISLMRPDFATANALAEQLMDVVATTEEGLNSALVQFEGQSRKISSIQQDIDTIELMVGELIDGGAGQHVDLTAITQTKANLELMALSGTFKDYDEAGEPVLDTWAKAGIDILSDKIALVVESDGGSGWQVASTIITDDSIASKVAGVIEQDASVIASISEIVQTSDAIMLRVRELEGSITERLDELRWDAQAGISVTSQRVAIEAQERNAMGETLQGLIAVEADRITMEVSRATAIEGDLGSRLVITESGIGALVAGGGGSTGFMSLSVGLPVFVNATQYDAMVAASTLAKVTAVYGYNAANAFYYAKSDATPADCKALRDDLRVAGLLASQFAVEADEILFDGSAVFTNGKLPAAGVDGLGALATKSAISMSDMDPTLTVNGKLKADFIEADAIQIGDLDGYADAMGAKENVGVAAGLAAALQAQVDKKIESWYQDATPSWTDSDANHKGDQWYHLTNRVWKRYDPDGTPDQWILMQEADALAAQSAASDAGTLAAKKSTMWADVASATEGGAVVGDLFLASGLLYRITNLPVSTEDSTRISRMDHGSKADADAVAAITNMIKGDTLFRSDEQKWYVYSGTAWVADGVAVETKGTAAAAVATFAATATPRYRGLDTVAATLDAKLVNTGDWGLLLSATATSRQVRFRNAAGNVTYSKVSDVIADKGLRARFLVAELISDLMGYINANGTGMGTMADYGVSFVENLAVLEAFIESLTANELTVKGELIARRLNPSDVTLSAGTTYTIADSSALVDVAQRSSRGLTSYPTPDALRIIMPFTGSFTVQCESLNLDGVARTFKIAVDGVSAYTWTVPANTSPTGTPTSVSQAITTTAPNQVITIAPNSATGSHCKLWGFALKTNTDIGKGWRGIITFETSAEA